MVHCPVCGKWLKHTFALGGHIRLKGDYAHSIYFETHKFQNPKKESTDLENQVKELISVVKQQSEDLTKIILPKLEKLIELFIKPNTQPIMPIKQQEAMLEKPKRVIDIINDYGSLDEAVKYLGYFKVVNLIYKDPDLSLNKKSDLKDLVWSKTEDKYFY